jgi:CDGSH-type Zn-finger protein
VIPWPNGPLTVRGNVRIRTASGAIIAEEGRFALCRCGASDNQPFCDNSHRRVAFSDSEQHIGEDRQAAESPQDVHHGPGIDAAG